MYAFYFFKPPAFSDCSLHQLDFGIDIAFNPRSPWPLKPEIGFRFASRHQREVAFIILDSYVRAHRNFDINVIARNV